MKKGKTLSKEVKEIEDFFRSAGYVNHANALRAFADLAKEDMQLEEKMGGEKILQYDAAIGKIRTAIYNLVQSSKPIRRRDLKNLIDNEWDAISTIRHIDETPSFIRTACDSTMLEIERIAQMAVKGTDEDVLDLDDIFTMREISNRNLP